MPGPETLAHVDTRVTWKTPASDVLLQEVERLSELMKDLNPLAEHRSVAAPVLGDEGDDRLCVLIVTRDEDEISWTIIVSSPADPSSPPPTGASDVTKAAERFGGRPALAAVVSLAQSEQAAPMDYSVHFHVPADRWKCRTIPTPITTTCEDAPALLIGVDAQVVQVGYSFEKGANGVSRVELEWRKTTNEYHVYAVARGLLKLWNNRFLPFADEVRDVVVTTLFEDA